MTRSARSEAGTRSRRGVLSLLQNPLRFIFPQHGLSDNVIRGFFKPDGMFQLVQSARCLIELLPSGS